MGERSSRYLGRKEGVALITTLLIVSLVVAVVVEFYRSAVAEIDVSKNFSDEKKITYLAISGVNAVKDLLMLDGVYSKGDSFLEEWAKSRAYFQSATAALEEGKLEGVIIDETGKININQLVDEKGGFDETQKKIWERLLGQSQFGLTKDQIDTIIYGVKDWIDEDSEVTGIFGAEDSVYRPRGYLCKNAPFQNVEELLLVNGVTKGIFFGDERHEGIRPYFTVFGGGKINVNTAPVPVLLALANEMTEDIAGEMDKFRRDEANRLALMDKNWFKRIWPYGTPPPEKSLTVTSDAFSVYLRVTLHESVREVRAVISRPLESPASLIYWQEL